MWRLLALAMEGTPTAQVVAGALPLVDVSKLYLDVPCSSCSREVSASFAALDLVVSYVYGLYSALNFEPSSELFDGDSVSSRHIICRLP